MRKAAREPEPATAAMAPRQGPRPLGLHLAVAALTWTSSRAAWPLLRNGSLPWKAELRPAAAALQKSLANLDPDAATVALERQIRLRQGALLDGIEAYRRHPYRRDLPPAPEAWREGTTRLLDYGALVPGTGRGAGPPVLVIPSLINRAYVLDLTAETSLMRWLAGQGVRPYLVDWDRPGADERGFTLTDYIAGRLESALEAVLAATGRRPVVLGYCMGGLLALALAQRRRDELIGLALLATPWDFHGDGGGQAAQAVAASRMLSPLLDLLGELPVDAIQALFAGLDPQLVVRKFLTFARVDPAHPKAVAFVALEDWLNDGVPLAAPVARECLAGWYGENTPATGRWRVAGKVIDPARLDLPSLCVIPAGDRIVPPASAAALCTALPQAETLRPAAGHIGMVVGGRAVDLVWRPLLTWLKARGAAAG
ncbi:MAG TPA: alpha/beta fold hydrolase [Kiloniellales bacterium]